MKEYLQIKFIGVGQVDTEGSLTEEAFLKAPDRTALALAVASFPAVLAVDITFAEEPSAVASCRVDPKGIAFVVEGTTFAAGDTEAFVVKGTSPSMAVGIAPSTAEDIAPFEAGGIAPSEAGGIAPFAAEDILAVADIAPFEADIILAVVDIIQAALQGRLDPFLEDKRLH